MKSSRGKDYLKNWLKKSGDNIDVWTFTNNGFYGDGNYYLRVAGCESYGQTWDPNGDNKCQLANSSRKIDQRYFLDQGFLKLVLLGLKEPDDYRVETSLEKINRFILHPGFSICSTAFTCLQALPP